MKSDALPVSYTETGLLFSDGSHIPGDVIVFATRFESNMRESARSLLGDAISDRLQDFWGFDEEGEIRGAYKPCGCKWLFSRLWVWVGGMDTLD